MINDDESPLRNAERELYTTDIIPPKRRNLSHVPAESVTNSWNAPESAMAKNLKPKIEITSVFKNLFKIALVFLVIALGVLGVSLLSGNNAISAKNVDIAITTKTFVDGGETFPVQVTLVNKNKVPLELVTLVLEYPEGTSENTASIKRIERTIQGLESGGTHQESFLIALYGTEGSEKQITAHLEFRVPGSNAIYDRDEMMAITVRTSPVRLTLTAPEQAIPNQEIPLTITIVGNGTESLPNTAMVVTYPQGFTFTRAEPVPSFNNHVWFLGDLPPGVNRSIKLWGKLSGSVTDLKTFTVSIGSEDPAHEDRLARVYNTLSQVVPLTNSFIETSIVVGGKTDATPVISASENTRVEIPWKNMLASQITNAEIRVKLSGNAYDPAKIQASNGFFQSATNEIVWTKQQVSALGVITPGADGTVAFSITPKRFVAGQGASNPSITVSVSVSGYETGGSKRTAENSSEKKLVLGSDLNFVAKTLHASGPIQNSGPVPLVPNQETTYTLEWTVTNTQNRVKDVVVSTILPTYVTWKALAVPEAESNRVVYNAVTRELRWNVGEVPAGTGTNLPIRRVSMKVGITPSTDQTGNVPELTDIMTVTGFDDFAKSDITLSRTAMTTRLLNE